MKLRGHQITTGDNRGNIYPLWTTSASLPDITGIWVSRFTPQRLNGGAEDFTQPRQDPRREARLKSYYDEGLASLARRFHAHVTRELKRGQAVLLILPKSVTARGFIDFPPPHLRYEPVHDPTVRELDRGNLVLRAALVRP